MSLSLSQVAAHAARALKQTRGPAAVAYAWNHGWAGGDTIIVDGSSLALRYCSSPLEVREALSKQTDDSQVLLIAVPEIQLGQDVLARLFRHRLLHVDRWQLVQDEYGVHQVDPRLFGMGWMPDLLLDAKPATRSSAAAALTFDEAMQTCLAPVLGLEPSTIDIEGLLQACESSSLRWSKVPAEAREQFRQYLADKLGSLAQALLATMDGGNAHAAVAIGLVCEVLYSNASLQIPELRDARVRLEQRVNGWRLKESDGRQWAELANRVVADRALAARTQDFKLAIGLLQDIGAREFVGVSSVLPESLDARLAVLGESVGKFMRSTSALPDVEAAAQNVLSHHLPPTDHPGKECARMLVRLCRYDASLGPEESVVDLVADYLQNGAWEDWARRTLRGSRPEGLARVVARLLDRVADRRKSRDLTFATKLAQSAENGTVPVGVLEIESALMKVLAPLAQLNPVLLVVLDGMSQDVYLAIADTMMQRGWVSWSRQGQPRALLATTPSVTECSRASLLAGRLLRGIAAQEKVAFSTNEALKRVSRSGKPPLLLHKAGLEQSHQLTDDVVQAIGDVDQRVVSVVINAIDDALAKSEQVRIDWTLESIPLLAAVLEQARLAGRVVVLTSDHGHVLERKTVARPGTDGERWRRTGVPEEDGEITLRGPRIEKLMGEPLVLPWSELIRYSVKKNGYHGGVSRQEMLVPIGIWTANDAPEIDGAPFVADLPTAPAWWTAPSDIVSQPAIVTQQRKTVAKAPAGPDLFSAPVAAEWIDQLMESAMLVRQTERAGRMALEASRLRTLLLHLHKGGGRASTEQLATAIGQPPLRMRGIISAMERMLNLDGFPIVTLERGTGTVLLDVALLKAQFLA